MALSVECTPQEAINPYFIIREILKLLIGVFLFLIYSRLIYVLITQKQFFSNVFYKMVSINGISVGLEVVVIIRHFLVLRLLSFLCRDQQISYFFIFSGNWRQYRSWMVENDGNCVVSLVFYRSAWIYRKSVHYSKSANFASENQKNRKFLFSFFKAFFLLSRTGRVYSIIYWLCISSFRFFCSRKSSQNHRNSQHSAIQTCPFWTILALMWKD